MDSSVVVSTQKKRGGGGVLRKRRATAGAGFAVLHNFVGALHASGKTAISIGAHRGFGLAQILRGVFSEGAQIALEDGRKSVSLIHTAASFQNIANAVVLNLHATLNDVMKMNP